MDHLSTATKILREARNSIANLAEKAIRSQDFDTVGRLAAMAKQLDSLCSSGAESSASLQIARAIDPISNSIDNASPRKRSKKTTPHFKRTGSDLAKVAPKKNGKGTYEHKAPKSVLDLLVGRLSIAKSNEQLVRLDEILPGKTAGEKDDIPSYQAYLCLGWLRDEGLVVQHGRRGYTIPAPESLRTDVERKFLKLG